MKSSDTIQIHKINGETFNVEKEDGLIYLSHKQWSLTGVGETIIAAQKDLLNDASLIADTYLKLSDTQLSAEAQKLKQFLAKLI